MALTCTIYENNFKSEVMKSNNQKQKKHNIQHGNFNSIVLNCWIYWRQYQLTEIRVKCYNLFNGRITSECFSMYYKLPDMGMCLRNPWLVLDDSGIIALVQNCHNLEYLKLQSENLSTPSLHAISDFCSNLFYLSSFEQVLSLFIFMILLNIIQISVIHIRFITVKGL
jgi:hypothetical protein